VGDISASGLNMVRLVAIIRIVLKSGTAHPALKRTGLLGGGLKGLESCLTGLLLGQGHRPELQFVCVDFSSFLMRFFSTGYLRELETH